MTDQELANVTHKFKLMIQGATAKHRRENLIIPTGDEYVECWYRAVEQSTVIIGTKRTRGRPKPHQPCTGPLEDDSEV